MTAVADTPAGQRSVDGEVTRVVDMLDALAAGDVALTITGLEDLLARLWTAEAARELLVDVDRNLLKAALVVRRQRVEDGAQR